MVQQQSATQPKSVPPQPLLRDCGRASEKTRGFFNMLFYENGFPPFNTTFFQI
jgi:hypothetical protein